MINVNAPFVAGDFFVSGGKVGASVIQVADHIDYAKKSAATFALGPRRRLRWHQSAGASMEDVSTYPVLTAELLKRGYSDDEIIAINGGNVLRCLEKNRGRRRAAAAEDRRSPASASPVRWDRGGFVGV